MNSLVAFPLGTAPCKKGEWRQGWLRVPASHSEHSHFKGAITHTETGHFHPDTWTLLRITLGWAGAPQHVDYVFRIMPTPMSIY